MNVALENSLKVPTELLSLKFILPIKFPKSFKCGGWDGGGVNMEYSKLCLLCANTFLVSFGVSHINSHDVKQTVANAVKISEADVIGQIYAWCDDPRLDSIRFHQVKNG